MATTADGTIIIAALASARALAKSLGVQMGGSGVKTLAREYLKQHDAAVQAVKDLESQAPSSPVVF